MHYKSLIAFACVLALASTTHATVIGFDLASGSFSNNAAIPQDHGDRVTAATQDGYAYGSAHGFTPNIVVDWNTGSGSLSSSAVYWSTSFGDLTGVIESEPEPNGTQFTLSADPGFLVQLHGFDMAGWSTADYTINAVRVRDGNDNILFENLNASILGAGPSHSDFDFTTPLSAPVIKIEWDSSNLGGSSDNIGLDNIAFSQIIPEPTSASLTLLASLSLLPRRRSKS